MPEHQPAGPILKIATPVALLTWTGVIIGVFWGLNWRWIPTTLIGTTALILVACWVENHLDRRAEQRAERRRLAWETTVLQAGMLDTTPDKDQTR